jgi:hypothetical protein
MASNSVSTGSWQKVRVSGLRFFYFALISRSTLSTGLAQTAVHHASSDVLFPESFFHQTSLPVTHLTEKLPFLSLATESPTVHAFTVLARMLKDPVLTLSEPGDDPGPYTLTLQTKGEQIRKYAQQWTIDLSKPGELERKIEELSWANTIIYAIGGWSPKRAFRANFFL